MNAKQLHRWLFCPLCGKKVRVETDGKLPEIHVLPDHAPLADGVNMCSAVVVRVQFEFATCAKCGALMGKHPSGLCRACYVELVERTP